MEEAIRIVTGIAVLILGVPIGIGLRKKTKDESKQGQKWFKLLVGLGVVGGIIGLVLGEDFLLFGFLFMAVVSGMSLRKR